MMNISVVPKKFSENDPRSLPYHFPNFPIVKYAKIMNEYNYYYALKAAEEVANKNGFFLLPTSCMHWQRKAKFTEMNRKIKVGNYTFFMMRENELTESERQKLERYLEELNESA
ncbi:MAG TPA: hypothetical protein GX497_03460 [Bacillus bacterium]|nr:hypothetical protein [Bacillus sp. (in: firmicutes)]